MSNEFLPFATVGGANVLTQSAYSALSTRPSGFVSGLASAAAFNKAMRQSSSWSVVLGKIIDDYTVHDALDDGDTATLQTHLLEALNAYIGSIYAPLTAIRVRLLVDTSFYVNGGTGSDSTGDGSSGAPWKTIQKAVDVLTLNYDFNGKTATVNIANGTYSESVLISNPIGSGILKFLGNTTTPSSVVISSGGDCLWSMFPGVQVAGIKFVSSTGNALTVGRTGNIEIVGKCDFGACTAGMHLIAYDTGSRIIISSNYNVTGGALAHWYASGAGNISTSTAGFSVAISSSLTFSYQWARAIDGGLIRVPSMTFTGSAPTCPRYAALNGGGIQTGGGGASYIPGNSAGSATSPGWYA